MSLTQQCKYTSEISAKILKRMFGRLANSPAIISVPSASFLLVRQTRETFPKRIVTEVDANNIRMHCSCLYNHTCWNISTSDKYFMTSLYIPATLLQYNMLKKRELKTVTSNLKNNNNLTLLECIVSPFRIQINSSERINSYASYSIV